MPSRTWIPPASSIAITLREFFDFVLAAIGSQVRDYDLSDLAVSETDRRELFFQSRASNVAIHQLNRVAASLSTVPSVVCGVESIHAASAMFSGRTRR